MKDQAVSGSFVDRTPGRWYRIGAYDRMAPFFIALAGDSDVWAFISTNGSLAAGRRDQERSFFPYETVDKIHARWESSGPRTWILVEGRTGPTLWEPFARRPGIPSGTRNLYKNIAGTRLLFEEIHPDGNLRFLQEWSSSDDMGLVRKASISCLSRPERVRILDGLLSLIPPGVTNSIWNNYSNLADAYKWNESRSGGRLGIFTMYAQMWDRAEPKESFETLVAWRSGLAEARTLLSSRQVEAFCEGLEVTEELLSRGRAGAFLAAFDHEAAETPFEWYQVIDGPLSQSRAADLAARLESGWGSPADIEASLAENASGLDGLLSRADAFQRSGVEMAAVHHTANVLFNIMRGGLFPSGTAWKMDDLRAFMEQRNRELALETKALLSSFPPVADRADVLAAARRGNPQVERLVREYLPLAFSRRHGDPSRPWNRFSIRVRDGDGRRVMSHQGNWRDIFQNWEALLWSEPDYAGSMISTFLSAMTPDGHNPYRITREGIEWETIDSEDPWSFIGYWGDHQVVYLLKLLEAAEAFDPGLLSDLWARPVFAFADLPYRIRSHGEIVADPKSTIIFDRDAHEAALARAKELGADGKLVLDSAGRPVLGSLAEKLLAIVLDKAGNLVPGGGIWLNTQRPEWNDANNALVGNGLSLVTLSSLRRLLTLIAGLPCVDDAVDLPAETAAALEAMDGLAGRAPARACIDPRSRRSWLDGAGRILETWRRALYGGWERRAMVTVPRGAFASLVRSLLPIVETTLRGSLRGDGLYDSYNILTLSEGAAEVESLYPMLEGQVAMIASGLLGPDEVVDLGRVMKASRLFDARRRSYLLYPDRELPGFLEKNVLDVATLALEPVRRLLAAGRSDILETQRDGTVRFAPGMANRRDVESALRGSGDDARTVADAYERLLRHKEFTGRSGTMFGYEGLGCIYWHMVAKLLLAVQEAVFRASDARSPRLADLKALYRDIRSGLGYMKSPAEYGAFPFDPYSHTPSEGGAQQPGMTGQVKEEILTRWGELGIRWKSGRMTVDPIILDPEEIREGVTLEFTFRRIPFTYRRGPVTRVRALTEGGWASCADGSLPDARILKVEAEILP